MKDFKYSNNPDLNFKLNNLPSNPGVYIYKNREGDIIYIGKAKVLKSRIRSYFLNAGKHQQFKTEILLKHIANIEYIITDSELEALLLESNLIKKHKPKYNIDLKDDKSYPYIKFTKELFPRIEITRKVVDDGSKYYGPYTNVKSLRELLRSLKNIYKIRNCSLSITKESIENKKHRLCLDYHIGNCGGCCNGIVDSKFYTERAKDIISFITANDKTLISRLKSDMNEASKKLEFEKAASFRDQIAALDTYLVKQKVDNSSTDSIDYIAISQEDNDSCCVIFKVRNGRVIARNNYFLKGVYRKSEPVVLTEFVKLYYNRTTDYPDKIFISSIPDELEILEEWLSSLKGKKLSIKSPKIGEKNKMVFLTKKNAELLLNDYKLEKLKKDYTPRSLNSLKRDLNLSILPRVIECFDISHFAGRETVASMVVFKDAKPYKSGYRKFKIKSVEGIDDFASMREVVERRYSRVKNENLQKPDLIVIDGGKGQLSSAKHILDSLGLDIKVIGLAKRLEEVFLPGESEPEFIPRTSSAIKLLQSIRDEAHRFAITFHRNLREKEQVKSLLDDIKGIGPAKRKLLLDHFNSVEEISKLPVKELVRVKGITEDLAKSIVETLRGSGEF
ncbi:MAG: excinuclease ABC subunit C [Candidatus Cloacimonadota bacterium]|nr:MAG: excinuclease ABC subunit C [Candidatus Cloacimonadota bacterium]PIE77633.1 MAG: excinuclease ABC subunit C [Candidatus Delongbacteria bacterium]